MATIWRFEDDFITSCDAVMKETLSTLARIGHIGRVDEEMVNLHFPRF